MMIKNKPVQIPIDTLRLCNLIVSKRDSVFTSKFWFPSTIFKLDYGYNIHIIYENIN